MAVEVAELTPDDISILFGDNQVANYIAGVEIVKIDYVHREAAFYGLEARRMPLNELHQQNPSYEEVIALSKPFHLFPSNYEKSRGKNVYLTVADFVNTQITHPKTCELDEYTAYLGFRFFENLAGQITSDMPVDQRLDIASASATELKDILFANLHSNNTSRAHIDMMNVFRYFTTEAGITHLRNHGIIDYDLPDEINEMLATTMAALARENVMESVRIKKRKVDCPLAIPIDNSQGFNETLVKDQNLAVAVEAASPMLLAQYYLLVSSANEYLTPNSVIENHNLLDDFILGSLEGAYKGLSHLKGRQRMHLEDMLNRSRQHIGGIIQDYSAIVEAFQRDLNGNY